MIDTLTMSVGRDYRTTTRYEFVVFHGENPVCREGGFNTAATARRNGLRAAEQMDVWLNGHTSASVPWRQRKEG